MRQAEDVDGQNMKGAMNTKSTIEQFILDQLLIGSDRTDIPEDEELVNSGIIDSMGMLRLITFLEEKFDFEIGDGDVGDQNFGTLGRLVAFVDQKRGETA
jgi:acyl carrier protein